jgi:hypothetical protein
MADRLMDIFDDNILQQPIPLSDVTFNVMEFYDCYVKLFTKYYKKTDKEINIDRKLVNALIEKCNLRLVILIRTYICYMLSEGKQYSELDAVMTMLIQKLGLSDSDWYMNKDGLLKWLNLTAFLNRTNGYLISDQRKLVINIKYTGCNSTSNEAFQTVSLVILQLQYQLWLHQGDSEEALIDGFLMLGSLINIVSMNPETIIRINNEGKS